jgi:hypothetical protein
MPVVDGQKFPYTADGKANAAKARRRKTAAPASKAPGDPTRRPDLEKTATARRCPPAPTRSPVASGRMALPTAPGGLPPGVRPPGMPGMAGGGRPSPPGMPSPQGIPSIPAGGVPSSVMARPPIPGLAGGIPSGRPPQMAPSPAIQQILNQLRRRPPQ